VDDVARALNLGRATTWALVASGIIPSLKIGKRRLVRWDDLAAYVERLSAEQGK
jgi:excisionase family DNA binding protein